MSSSTYFVPAGIYAIILSDGTVKTPVSSRITADDKYASELARMGVLPCTDSDTRSYHNGVSVKTADYTLAAGDNGYLVVMNKGTACALTIPPGATADLGANAIVRVMCQGVGTATVTAGSGVTLVGTAELTTGLHATLLRSGSTDTWYIA